MAYYDGDLDCEKLPVVDRMDAEYTLYVNNLPVELNKRAIEEMFAAYGEVTGILRPGTAAWAYITYRNYRDAEYAIRDLNNKKPLCLKIALAKERFTREEQKSNVVVEEPKPIDTADSLPIHNDVKYQSVGCGQSINARKRATPLMAYRHANYESPSSVSLDVHDSNEDPYANTNTLWTRGKITVTQDGKRHVSLGRGYTLYECPDPHPKVEECISKVYEQRKNGLYEYSEDKLKNGIHNCSICSTKTTKHCEKCRTYYCSKVCQLQDWPRHQAECERIPALVEDAVNDISSLQINQDLNQMKTTSPNIINKSSDIKLRRPNTTNMAQVENSSNMNGNINMHKSNADVTYNSKNNSPRDRHSFDQHNNDVNQVSRTKMTDQSVVNATNTKEFSQQHRLRKHSNIDENNTDQSKKNNESSSTSHSTDQSRFSRNQSDSNRNSFNKEKYNRNDNVRDKTYNNAINHPQKNNSHNDKGSACQNSRESPNKQGTNISNNASMNKLDLNFYKETCLSKTKFITVNVIITLGNGEYWINRVEDTEARINLMKKLQEVVESSPNVQPIVGRIYGALYKCDGLWYRVMVTSLNPVKINFIDFGNDETLKKDDEIKDIGDLAKTPRFSRKIRLTQSTSDKYRNLQEGETMSVRMLSTDTEETIIVEIQEESKSSSSHTTESASNNAVKKLMPQENNKVSPKKSTKAFAGQTPNILDTLADLFTQNTGSELQINGAIQIFEISEQKNVYSATLTPQICCTEVEMIFNDLQDDCSEIEVTADYQPKTEELICGKCSDGWYRGYVPETSNSSIFCIDEARNKSVDKILPCPEKYLNVCALGVMCEINHPISELQVAHHFKAVMKSPNQESLKIEIIINSEIIQAVVRPWKFTTNPVPQLKNGSKICLTSYRNHYHMYARSLEENQIEYYNNVMQSVARYAQTAPRLTEPPVNHQIVIAPFEDGNNYRAMVHKTENDKAKIIYIDFGNVDEVNIKDLKVMPLCSSLQQGCAARIMLKDVPQNVPSNEEVDLYIRNLLGKEVPLVCTYEGTSPKNGVRLTMLTGECVNDKINNLLVPGWKKEDNHDITCYMIDDIKIASLGRVGDIVEAVVLYIRENDQTYMMSPSDVELITHIGDVLPKMLAEYCEKMEYYIPRVKELCLALYDGAWYRAACLNPKESYTTSQILFIDYGNIEIVEHKNIRLMPKDFITPVAMANMCTVVNLAPFDSTGNYSKAVQKKLQELIQPFSTVRIKLVEFIENGYYNVELPDVRDALIKDGLV